MEKHYIKTEVSEIKSKMMAEQLDASPMDKRKAQFGETNQADYLIMAKEHSAEKKKVGKQLFDSDIREERNTALKF
jgi:hypothetical protein